MFREFPARAGINRSAVQISGSDNGVPRASGDKPYDQNQGYREGKSSPRERG